MPTLRTDFYSGTGHPAARQRLPSILWGRSGPRVLTYLFERATSRPQV